MAELRRGPGGRPMTHMLRVVVDAIRYLVRYGWNGGRCRRTFLRGRWCTRSSSGGPPAGCPSGWLTGCAAAAGGRRARRNPDRRGDRLPVGQGRGHGRGRDQRIRWREEDQGRKRHVAVDSNGWLLAVLVTAANVQDRDVGHRLVALLRERFSTITLVWADGGYAGRLVAWAAARAGPDRHHRQTHRQPARVRRASPPVGRGTQLRLAEPAPAAGPRYERRPEHHEAMLLWATTMIMTRQLVHQRSGEPPRPRWGAERSMPPAQKDPQAA